MIVHTILRGIRSTDCTLSPSGLKEKCGRISVIKSVTHRTAISALHFAQSCLLAGESQRSQRVNGKPL